VIVRRLSGQLSGGFRLGMTPGELWGVESLTQVSAGTLHEWMVELSKVPVEAKQLLTYTSRNGAWLSAEEICDER